MGEVISIEARKYIPVPMTEVMLDWSVIPKEDAFSENEDETERRPSASTSSIPFGGQHQSVQKQPTQEVLVVAIHNEYLNTYQTIMSGSNLTPSFYEIEIFSSVRAVVDQGVHPVVVLDMGARATKLYIVERGILRSSHIINKGGQDITLAISQAMSVPVSEAENLKRVQGLKGGPEYKALTEIITINLDYIFYEVNAVILNYQKKSMKNVGHVIMTGGGVLLKGLPELAKISFQTEVAYADPFGKLETPAFLAEQFATAGPEFSVAIGVALRRLSELN
jgi:Tfp pilus assembly PilM family ATPase